MSVRIKGPTYLSNLLKVLAMIGASWLMYEQGYTPVRLRPLTSHRSVTVAALALTLTLQGSNSMAKDGPIRSLSTGEKSAVIVGSLGIGALSKIIPNKDVDSASYLGYQANPVDRWWRLALHGGTGRKTNFVDNSAGSLIAPFVGGLAIAAVDINRREFSRDIPFFIAGAITTAAVTDAGKRAFNRPRPYCQAGGVRPPGHAASDSYHVESFFSGHSSQAFFAAGFVNNRLRRHMRQDWRREEYRSWRWASPLLTFGWATFVAGSRIQADKHHFTDVATGALVGYGLSELFYRLCYGPGQTPEFETPMISRVFSLVLTF